VSSILTRVVSYIILKVNIGRRVDSLLIFLNEYKIFFGI